MDPTQAPPGAAGEEAGTGGSAGAGASSTAGSGNAAGTSHGGAAGSSTGAGGTSSEGAGAGGAGAGEGGDAGAGGSSDPVPDPPNVAFISSETFVLADLGGLDAADAACGDLASAANLEGSFVAWLSSSSQSARDRLGAASGWINTRGNPFADQSDELFAADQVYFPIGYDELGRSIQGSIATGTLADGSAAPQNCLDWTSSSGADALLTGDAHGGSVLWTQAYDGSACDAEYHLYCFQIDYRAKLYPTPSQGRTVFVSSTPFTLAPNGRAAADALCAADAAAAQLSGTFVALLGTSTEAPLARFTQPTRPWVRPDGMPVASASSSLLQDLLEAPISQQADGAHVGGTLVYGTPNLQNPTALSCGDWTNPAAVAPVIVGQAGYNDARWRAAHTASCSETARVLCAQP
jgi:hypothetical protein